MNGHGRHALEPPAPEQRPVPSALKPLTTLLQAGMEDQEHLRLSPQTRWWGMAVNRFAKAGIYLLAGPPGSRKSGLALQLALDLARSHQRTLFVLTEEPAS